MYMRVHMLMCKLKFVKPCKTKVIPTPGNYTRRKLQGVQRHFQAKHNYYQTRSLSSFENYTKIIQSSCEQSQIELPTKAKVKFI